MFLSGRKRRREETSENEPNTLVLRDDNGDFAANTITANAFNGPLLSTSTNTENVGSVTSAQVEQSVLTTEEYVQVSTGITSGLVLSVASATQFSISPGKATFNLDGVLTSIDYAGTTQTVQHLNASLISFVTIDANSLVEQFTARPSRAFLRDHCYLGVLVHVDLATLTGVNNQHVIAEQPALSIYDISTVLGFLNISGNVISGDSLVDLTISKSAGEIFIYGSNFENNSKDPHIKSLSALPSPAQFQYRLQNGTNITGLTNTVLKPDIWDNNGVETTVDNNTKFTVQRVFLFSSNLIKIQPGQKQYSTFEDARAGASDPFNMEPSFSNGIFVAQIILEKGITASNEATFYQISKFGTSVGGSNAAVTLQNAYDNNTISPQINATNGFDLRSGAGQTIKFTASDGTDILSANEFAKNVTVDHLIVGSLGSSNSISILPSTDTRIGVAGISTFNISDPVTSSIKYFEVSPTDTYSYNDLTVTGTVDATDFTGVGVNSTNVANTVVKRDANGDFQARNVAVNQLDASTVANSGDLQVSSSAANLILESALGNVTTKIGTATSATQFTLEDVNGKTIWGVTGNGVMEIDSNRTTSSQVIFQAKSQEAIESAAGSVKCRMMADGDMENVTGRFTQVSDARFKENIRDSKNYLDDMLRVQVRKFNLANSNSELVGFVAQELEEVMPELVKTNYGSNWNGVENYKSVSLTSFIPMLVKCIQELKEEIEKIKKK